MVGVVIRLSTYEHAAVQENEEIVELVVVAKSRSQFKHAPTCSTRAGLWWIVVFFLHVFFPSRVVVVVSSSRSLLFIDGQLIKIPS